jgi:hypothetical protein
MKLRRTLMIGPLVWMLLLTSALALATNSAAAKEIHAVALAFGSVGEGGGQFARREVERNTYEGLGHVAVDNSNGPSKSDVYVADQFNHRIEKFDSAGEFILTFGKHVNATTGGDVCTAASHNTCQAGTAGVEQGELTEVGFIAIDNSSGSSEGDIYVTNYQREPLFKTKVYKYTPEGKLITSFGSDGEVLLEGESIGIGVDETGKLYDLTGNATLDEYTASGVLAEKKQTEFENLSNGSGIAVNALGEVYAVGELEDRVVKLGLSGEILNREFAPKESRGVAIDPANEDVYVLPTAGGISRYSASGSLLESSIGIGEGLKQQGAIAVDRSDHSLYVTDPASAEVFKFTLQEVEAPVATIEAPSHIGYTDADVSGMVEPKNRFITSCRFEYVTSEHFAGEGFVGAESQSCVPNPEGTGAVSVAATLVNLKPATSYRVRLVAENRAGASAVEVSSPFETKGPIDPPQVSIEPVSQVTSTTAYFSGLVAANAPGPAPGQDPGFNTHWVFQCTPGCGSSPAGELEGDDHAHAVSGEATGLSPGTSYEVALVGENAGGSVETAKVTFATPAVAPTILSDFVENASQGEAVLGAEIDPGGAATSYRFQYITEKQFMEDGESFGSGSVDTSSIEIGSGDATHKALDTIVGLTPGVGYRFRVIATNEKTPAGGLAGPVQMFYTYPSPSFASCANAPLREVNGSLELPDCRAFEQVSPAGDAEVFIPFGQSSEEGFAQSGWPMQAAVDGDSVVYVGEAESSGRGGGTGNSGGGEGDVHLAMRDETGWTSSDIQPAGSYPTTGYAWFSSDLSTGVIGEETAEPLSAGLETPCQAMYSTASGSGLYKPLFTNETVMKECDKNMFFVGASADDSQLLFESKAVLVSDATESPSAEGDENIYDSVQGRPVLVNVLPGPNPESDPEATAGSDMGEPEVSGVAVTEQAVNASAVISADGSRVFWTDLKTGVIYMRLNPAQSQSAFDGTECDESTKACTVAVSSGSATYWTATPDGRYVYYTENGELWRFDTQSDARKVLAGSGAGVLGVIGVNETGEDGSYVYFVASGKLAADATARECKLNGVEEGCNVYVLHDGVVSLAVVLSPADNGFSGNIFATPHPVKGDWRPILGYRSAELTPDGSHLVFMSYRQLTTYQNAGDSEVYIYDAESGGVSCVSCAPTGVAPSEPDIDGGSTYVPGDFLTVAHMRRWVSADGDEVFFDTNQPLVPQDMNKAQDVYEWERAGTGSCVAGSVLNGGGCVYLLSGGAGGASTLIESDASGQNVFFVTRSALIPGQLGETPVLYDARAGGGLHGVPGRPVEPPACEGSEACRPPASEPPVEPFPASSAFSGAGNLLTPAEAPPGEEPLQKAKKCGKGLTRKGGKCVHVNRGANKHKTRRKAAKKRARRGSGKRRAGR